MAKKSEQEETAEAAFRAAVGAAPATLELRVQVLEDELARLKKYLNIPEAAHG